MLLLALGQHLRGSHPTHQHLAGLPDPGRPGVLGVVDHLQLRVQVGKLLLRPLPPPAAVGQLTEQEYAAIIELLRTASDVDGVDASAPPYDQMPPPPPAAIAKTDEAATPPAVEVGVLGRVEVRGVPKIERAKSIELIVYLALHRHGVDGEQLWEALWPDKPINRGTLHTTVTAARTGLGRAPDGSRYLPNAGDGLYQLSPAVSLDWDRFRALAAPARPAAPTLPACCTRPWSWSAAGRWTHRRPGLMSGRWSTAPRWKPSSPKPLNAWACSTWTPATPSRPTGRPAAA
jgi:hypothetical protein